MQDARKTNRSDKELPVDSVTQAALGAAVGGAVLGRRLGRKAIVVGALLGTLPDLDVLIDYGDAVANVTEHRGFSHSLFVLTGLGSLLALLSAYFFPTTEQRPIRFRHWWWFYVLCLTTHPLLDSLTTYGTQLFWPLDMPPLAWPVVFIIDPLYTLPLLIALLVGLTTQRVRNACAVGLLVSSGYLLLAAGAKWSVEQRLAPVLVEQGLQHAPRLVQPTPFNTVLWRATVVDGDTYYESLIGLFDRQREPTLEPFQRSAKPGEYTFKELTFKEHTLGKHTFKEHALEEHALTTSLGQRLAWFAGPFLRYDTRRLNDQKTLIATDIRLGFPGFHPFSFTLAQREGDEWQPVASSEQIDTSHSVRLDTLARLAARAAGDVTALCASDFVEPKWHAAPRLSPCYRMDSTEH